MNRSALIIILILSCIPIKVMAIEISEVAWMGSAVSANHEWIELHSQQTIDVTGWTIADGNNLSIELTGTIGAGNYAVLERTSDASAPGTAWQIYTGSLVNTGATLSLYDASGAVVDRVTGGENWQLIGGDNTTKATAQLSANGWITADPTPGQVSSGVAQVSTNDQSDQADADEDQNTDTNSSTQTTTSNKSSAAESIQLTLPDITLQLAIAAPKTTYVNQPVAFTVKPAGVGRTIASSLHYQWSFGDTNTGIGKSVEHVFSHPGNYVVVIEAEYKRQIQRTRHEIVVLPVSIALSQLDDGDFAIQNNSQTEIDLGGYRLVGDKTFTIPDYTILLPRSQVVVSRDVFLTKPISQMVALYDQAHQQTAMHLPRHLAIKVAAPLPPPDRPVVAAWPTPRISAIDDSPRYTFASANTAKPTPAPSSTTATTPAPLKPTQVAAVGTATVPQHWPQYALVAILLLGIAAVYLIPQSTKDDGPLA